MTDLNEFWSDVDTDSIEAQTGRGDPIPAGDYVLQLTSSEIKQTKAGTGIMLNCQFKVVEGEFEGRMIFGNFNIRNPNAQAQMIGIGQFKALCLATGIPFDTAKADTSALLYAPFGAKVGFGKTTAEYPDPKNEIKGYKPQAEAPAPKVAAKPAAKTTSAPGGLPWKKSA